MYEDHDFGIDRSEFRPPEDGWYMNNMLYYGDGKLTDNYYLRNVYLCKGNTFVNDGEHVLYVLGDVKVGDYLTTCPVYGVAFPTADKITAFAVATSPSVRHIDKDLDMVVRVNARFL